MPLWCRMPARLSTKDLNRYCPDMERPLVKPDARSAWGALGLAGGTSLRRRTRAPTVASTTSHADIRGLCLAGAEPHDGGSSGGAAV